MIAKLERTQSNAQQNKDKHRNPTEAHQTANQEQQNKVLCLGLLEIMNGNYFKIHGRYIHDKDMTIAII